MASSVTGFALALPDEGGVYKKVKRLYNSTGGYDASAGGYSVVLSGVGVVQGGKGIDIFGLCFDGVVSAAANEEGYVDVYCGLQDLFTGIVRSSDNASALVNGASVHLSGTMSLGVACANLDIVGQIENGAEAVSEAGRVIFALTPSAAIPGYDSGNTT